MNFILSRENGLEIIVEDVELMHMSFAGAIVFFALILLGIIALYVLRSIGVYKLAKKKGIKQAFMAWIPFVWVYPAYRLIPEYKLFGFSYGKFAVWFCVVFAVSQFIIFLINFFNFFPVIIYFLQGGSEVRILDGYLYAVGLNNHFDLPWINLLLKTLNYINYPLRIVSAVILISFYVALFRKYWPEHYILASILSVFDLFPIFIFVIRNKSSRSFADYARARYYGAENYNANEEKKERNNDNPFSEFGDKKDSKPKDPGDPFSDFFNDKDKN